MDDRHLVSAAWQLITSLEIELAHEVEQSPQSRHAVERLRGVLTEEQIIRG